MGPKNNTFESGLAVKPSVVKSERIEIVKTFKNLGPK